MIFAGQSRDQLRETYRAAWRRFKQQHTLSPLDKQVVAVISEHPEYHVIVESAAADLATAPRARPILLAFWSGEELGLLGSSHFIKDEALARRSIAAYLNFDMVGRMRDNRLDLQSVGSSSVWKGLVEQANVPIGFDIRTQDDPFLPTDSTTFYQAGIPVLSFFTGHAGGNNDQLR